MCKACGPNSKPGESASSSITLAPGITICGAARSKAKEKIRSKNTEKDLVDDYANILCILSHQDFIYQQLKLLNDAIPDRPKDCVEVNWLRFSSILSYYEKKCWFHDDILLPLGLLSSEDFLYYISRGYVLKDYGAGVRHGEFTHRLQWFVLSSIITNNFTSAYNKEAWSHSPFELYTSLGRGANPLWGFILDLDGVSKGENSAFSYPDYFHKWLLQQNAALRNIHKFVERRLKKRQSEFVNAIKSYITANSSPAYLEDQMLKKFLSSDPNEAGSAFNSFDKFLTLERWFLDIYLNESAEKFREVRDSKIPAYETGKKKEPTDVKPGHRTTAYVKLHKGNVYALTGSGIADESQTASRVQNSRGSLQ